MKPLYRNGILKSDAAKMVPAAAAALKLAFGNDYFLDTPDDFGWDADEKRMHDAHSLFMNMENPEELLGLFQNSDAQKMGSVVKAIKALRLAIGELSEQARAHLGEQERHRDQWLDKPKGVELLSLEVLRNRTEAASEAERWIENSGKTVRSDKRWNAIAVAFECCEIWERQKRKPPFLDPKRREDSPFGRFLLSVFNALEIDMSVKGTFRQLRNLDLTKPPICPTFLQAEKAGKNTDIDQ